MQTQFCPFTSPSCVRRGQSEVWSWRQDGAFVYTISLKQTPCCFPFQDLGPVVKMSACLAELEPERNGRMDVFFWAPPRTDLGFPDRLPLKPATKQIPAQKVYICPALRALVVSL